MTGSKGAFARDLGLSISGTKSKTEEQDFGNR